MSASNLHSSMDRFEDIDINDKDEVTAIYIPVWIDLKAKTLELYLYGEINLHSSMDRFEER